MGGRLRRPSTAMLQLSFIWMTLLLANAVSRAAVMRAATLPRLIASFLKSGIDWSQLLQYNSRVCHTPCILRVATSLASAPWLAICGGGRTAQH